MNTLNVVCKQVVKNPEASGFARRIAHLLLSKSYGQPYVKVERRVGSWNVLSEHRYRVYNVVDTFIDDKAVADEEVKALLEWATPEDSQIKATKAEREAAREALAS